MASKEVGFTFEGTSLQKLGRDMRHASLVVREETDKTVAVVGATITGTAKVIAAKHSKSIPGTIHLAVVPGAAVVRAGGKASPIAALYELGNKGRHSNRDEDTFRHPVWGNRSLWVTQDRYPFLRPALHLNRHTVTKQMELTWDRALRVAGFKGLLSTVEV